MSGLYKTTNPNCRLTADLIGRYSVHAIQVHAVDKQLDLIRACGKRRREVVRNIPCTGTLEIHTMGRKRTVLIGFVVILQFDSTVHSYCAIDRGRLDRTHAAWDMDGFWIDRYGYIRNRYSRWNGGRHNKSRWHSRQRDAAQVSRCTCKSHRYPAETSLE